MKQYIFLSTLLILFFTACSDKEIYVPKHLGSEWEKYETNKDVIIDTSSNVALLKDRKVLTKKDEVVDVDINSSYRVLSQSDGWIISSSIDGEMILTSQKDKSVQKKFDLKKTVAGASVKGNDLAVIFADNEIAIYDMISKKALFSEQGSKVIAVDSRIENPYFLKNLILFSTLDGKIIFVNTKLKKRLRTVIISSEEYFNNIISLHVLQNKIIAATSYTLASISQKEIREKYEIRNIVYDDDTIYIATKQGEIISLTPDLEVISKLKFTFAHFYAMVLKNNKLYVLEKGGYIIVLDKKSFDYSVHEIDFNDGFIFPSNDMIYVDDKKILTE